MDLLRCMSPEVCRFSDAGNDDLATRSGDRRPKTAKARNRGRYARSAVPLAQLWGFERRTCRVSVSARREVQGLRSVKHAGGFALIAWRPEKRGSSDGLSNEQRNLCGLTRVRPSGDDRTAGILGWRSDGRDHEVSILITGIAGLGSERGVAPRSNRSMMIMRPPQQGQRCSGVCG